jgi:hypothetical protein
MSHQISNFTHIHSIHFSALSMHYPQCKTLQSTSVICYITDIKLSRMTLDASVVCYHGYNAVANDSWAGSHLVPRILHCLLTEKAEKVEKGQIFWVHTYPTTPRRRGRRVQRSVEIGSEMWIRVSSILTNRQTNIHSSLYIWFVKYWKVIQNFLDTRCTSHHRGSLVNSL